jgi:hypothetical protein
LFVWCALGLGAASGLRLSWEVSTTIAAGLAARSPRFLTSPLGSYRDPVDHSAKAPPIKLIGGKGGLPPRDEVVVPAPRLDGITFSLDLLRRASIGSG